MPPMEGLQLDGPQGFQVVGQEQGARSGPGRRQGSLGAGVTAADDNDIEPGGKQHGGVCKMRVCGAADFTSGPLKNHRFRRSSLMSAV